MSLTTNLKKKKKLKSFEKGLEIAKTSSDLSKIAFYNGSIGKIYLHENRKEKALPYFLEALSIYEELGELSKKGEILALLGDLYFSIDVLDEIEKGLKYYEEALQIFEKLNEIKLKALCLNSIAFYWKRYKRDYSKALPLYEEALKIFDKIGDVINKALVLNNIAQVYFAWDYDKKNYDLALVMSEEALEIINQHGLGNSQFRRDLKKNIKDIKDFIKFRDNPKQKTKFIV